MVEVVGPRKPSTRVLLRIPTCLISLSMLGLHHSPNGLRSVHRSPWDSRSLFPLLHPGAAKVYLGIPCIAALAIWIVFRCCNGYNLIVSLIDKEPVHVLIQPYEQIAILWCFPQSLSRSHGHQSSSPGPNRSRSTSTVFPSSVGVTVKLKRCVLNYLYNNCFFFCWFDTYMCSLGFAK